MVVHAPSSWVLALLLVRQTAHVSPVVVAQKHDDIVGHSHSGIVIVEHLLVERPHLRSLLSRFACHLPDDVALVFHNSFKKFGVGLLAHGLVTVATHSDGHNVFRALHALNAFAEELVNGGLVCAIVPCTILSALASPFLMVARHRLMVGCTDDNAHLVGKFTVLWVVGIECPSPHGRPKEVAL